jgi:hypothetical protein
LPNINLIYAAQNFIFNRNPISEMICLASKIDSLVKPIINIVALSVYVACCCQEVFLFFLEAKTENKKKEASAHVDAELFVLYASWLMATVSQRVKFRVHYPVSRDIFCGG